MCKRFVSIWFRHLLTDWLALRRPALRNTPFVFARPDHGRKVITAASHAAEIKGIAVNMLVADAKVIVPGLQVFDDQPGQETKLLNALGKWAVRYTPVVATDLPDGLLLDVSGCPHLWGGEKAYLKEIVIRLRTAGYDVRAAIADSIGTAWAVSRFGTISPIVESGRQAAALMPLPPASLRLEPETLARLQKLGFYEIRSLFNMPGRVLRRRFGNGLLLRLGQALGQVDEVIRPLQFVAPYQERLPCLEPISTAIGIEIAVKRLLETLCRRLEKESKGLRVAILNCYRVDGKEQQISIGTNRASHEAGHLFNLFELKIPEIEPALGIELFILEAPKVEDVSPVQEALWIGKPGLGDQGLIELLDRVAVKVGADCIHRYFPDEHYWPERSFKPTASFDEKPTAAWRSDRRPVQLLTNPEPIEVTAPIPDYPPMLFIYKGVRHDIKKADGPERIEREWWLDGGAHRDYYIVEDGHGQRYWLFRSGHYAGPGSSQWFIHGFFA